MMMVMVKRVMNEKEKLEKTFQHLSSFRPKPLSREEVMQREARKCDTCSTFYDTPWELNKIQIVDNETGHKQEVTACDACVKIHELESFIVVKSTKGPPKTQQIAVEPVRRKTDIPLW